MNNYKSYEYAGQKQPMWYAFLPFLIAPLLMYVSIVIKWRNMERYACCREWTSLVVSLFACIAVTAVPLILASSLLPNESVLIMILYNNAATTIAALFMRECEHKYALMLKF